MRLPSVKLLSTILGLLLIFHFSTDWIGKEKADENSFRQVSFKGDSNDGASDALARLSLGKSLASNQQYEEAEFSLILAVKLFQAKNNMYGVEESRNALGKLYLDQGHKALADELFRASVLGRQMNRHEESDTINWGCAYQGMGELYSALRFSDDPQPSDSIIAVPTTGDAKVHFDSALSHFNRGGYRQAETEIDTALKLASGNPYRVLKAFILLLGKKYPEAKSLFSDALEENDSEIGAIAGLGHLGIIQKDYPYARSILESAYKSIHSLQEPDLYEKWIDQQILLGLGWVAANQNLHAEALDYFNECLNLAPDNLLALLGKGNSLIGVKRMADAQKVFNRVLELDSENPYALAEMGIIKLEQGAADQAEIDLKKAQKAGGELYTCPYEGLGLIYLKQGKIAEAKQSFERAIEINPNIEYRKFNELAKLYLKEGKREEAKELLAKSIENFPYDPEAERLLSELREDQKEQSKARVPINNAKSKSAENVSSPAYTIRRFAEVSPTSVLVPWPDSGYLAYSEDAYIEDRVLHLNDKPAALDLADLTTDEILKLINAYPKAATSIRIDLNRICDKQIIDSVNNLHAARIAITIPAGTQADGSLICLGNLNAEEMYLDLHRLDDHSRNGLSSLKSLRTLKIRDMNCADECLEPLSELTSLRELVLRGTKITGKGLKHFSSLTQLRKLDLWGTEISGRGLTHLKYCNNLKSLELGETPLSDEGLGHIAKLDSLEELGLISTNITDFGMHHLTSMHSLRRLKLSYTRITNDGLGSLASLEKLRSLDLMYTEVADEGMKFLGNLKTLEELNLGGTKITSQGMDHLADLPNLRSLILANTHIDDNGLEAIGRMKNLHFIELARALITGQGLIHLANLRDLNWLGLRSTPITDETINPISSLHELRSLVLANTALSDIGISHLSSLSKLEELDLGGTKISNEGLIHLSDLKELKQLELQDTHVSDAGLQHLVGLTELENLELGGTQVTDMGIPVLWPLANLEELNLANTGISDEGLAALTHFHKLWYVCLSGTRVSDKGLRALSQMTKLEDLALGYTRISDEGLSILSKLPALRRLLIWHTDVGDIGLEYLSKISTLEELEMSQTQISDAGIGQLLQLQNLRELEIGGTKITEDGIARLRKELPTCIVSHLSYDH